MVKRRFLCSLLCCSPCCAVLALVGANTRFVGANAMFATFAPRILWFAQRNLWLAPPNAGFAPRDLWFAPPNTSFALWIFSKITPSLFTINEGFFRKPTSPPLPLREGPPLSPSPFPLRGQGMCQPPYSVLKPLRYKVGGPSEVSPAAELHFAVCDRMDTNCLRAADRPISPLQHALMVKKLTEAARPDG